MVKKEKEVDRDGVMMTRGGYGWRLGKWEESNITNLMSYS